MADRMLPWGPWIGILKARQHICAVIGCEEPGKPHFCPTDRTQHHHGCVHYELASEELYVKHKAALRTGWGLLCEKHYALVKEIIERR